MLNMCLFVYGIMIFAFTLAELEDYMPEPMIKTRKKSHNPNQGLLEEHRRDRGKMKSSL